MRKGRTYKIDDIKCTWMELISKAEELDEDYAQQQIKYTSEAAKILEQLGHKVKVEECTG